jgi:glycerol-3-phosphate acyltransferase PlsY
VELAAGVLMAYLLGSIPTSYIVAKLAAGIDLREHGSRNLGATNLYRVLGWKYAVPVGLFDALKGAIPVLWIAPWSGTSPWLPVVLGAVAVLGHVYSVFVRFRGGKGVATAAGVVAALAPGAFAASAAVWILVVWLSGYVSVGSMSAALFFPLGVLLFGPEDGRILAVGIGLALLIVYTHRSNIRRLLQGTESRLRHRQAAP